MSAPEARGASASTTTTTETGLGLLDQVIGATKQTERDRAEELIRALTEEALKGTVTFNRNLVVTFDRAIAEIDRKVSEQLNQIMHNERFLKLEGSWRGLNYLVMNSETGTEPQDPDAATLASVSCAAISSARSSSTRASCSRRSTRTSSACPAASPTARWSAITSGPTIPRMSRRCGWSRTSPPAPLLPSSRASAPACSGSRTGRELSKPRDLAKIFETTEYIKWRGFRETEDSRFVSLVMPRVIARVPYGAAPSRSTSSTTRRRRKTLTAPHGRWTTTTIAG